MKLACFRIFRIVLPRIGWGVRMSLVLPVFAWLSGCSLQAQGLSDTVRYQMPLPPPPVVGPVFLLPGESFPSLQPPRLMSCSGHLSAPFFCRLEYRMQRKIPISFRLGNMEYVNALESKPHYGAWLTLPR